MSSGKKWDSYLAHIINYTLIDKAYPIFFLITNLMRIKTFPQDCPVVNEYMLRE